jgi:endoglucanase Acf2
MSRLWPLFLAFWCLVLLGPCGATAGEPIVRQGAGSYTTVLPPGAKGPPETIYRTTAVRGSMPTNGWWSSLAWLRFAERQYPHPLAVEPGPRGLRLYYPGTNITVNKIGIFGVMPPKSADDLTLGQEGTDEFAESLLDGYSDWFVAVRFAQGQRTMRVTYGHGSPFVYVTYAGGGPRVQFARPPKVWSGDERAAVLGVTVGTKHYGLFGPGGSHWTGLTTSTLTNQAQDKNHCSVAILPDDNPKTLDLFSKYAHAHVTGTRVAWSYDAKASEVTTTFTYETTAREGTTHGTLFALYPHQWRNAGGIAYHGEYPSVRGKMKLAQGTSFRTVMRYPGILPALPNAGGADKQRLAAFLRTEAEGKPAPPKDTYWEGKWLGRLATLIPMAEQYGLEELAGTLRNQLRRRLEQWFTAIAEDGRVKKQGLFYYDGRWGTLIGYPASYGSDTQLNDHHFHYGYFIKAAAEVARHDPAWGADDRWGAMVKLLIGDIANADRKDTRFPFLRCFDPYAGHSWASGHAKFGDGNNQESSSESMNAWSGLILWGEATGDQALRDLGIYLYTTEMCAIQEYWFDVHGENHPREYPRSVVTMVWGSRGVNETWFSADPPVVHGINWLPIHGGSLYLGQYPAYVEKNYAALVQENGGTRWKEWADLVWMYRALTNPEDAIEQFEDGQERTRFDAGGSKAHTFHWIYNLKALGQVDASVTANTPLYAVFRNGTRRSYWAYNMSPDPRTVTFSDGFRLRAEGQSFGSAKGNP